MIKKLILNDNKLYSLIYLTQLFTGMRIGEILALKTSDINFQSNIITISKTLSRNKNYKVIVKEATKTRAGERSIPIPRMIKKMLKERIYIANENNETFLFLNKKHNFIDSRDSNVFLKKVASEFMDATEISSHNLRHTYITRCAESGMSPRVLMKLVGYKDIETTLETYTTVFDNYTKSEMDKIQNYYKRNKIQIGEISRLKSNNWLKNSKLKEIMNKLKIFKYQIKNSFKNILNNK